MIVLKFSVTSIHNMTRNALEKMAHNEVRKNLAINLFNIS
jgi:hypothetical protein